MSTRFVTIESGSAQETIELGSRIGSALQGGDIVALYGDLGAGKTTITRGIAIGLGCERPSDVNSPTFVLMQHYTCARVVINHIDAYRLESGRDLIEVGVDDLFAPSRVTLIEWPERAPDLLAGPHFELRLESRGGDRREIRVAISNHLDNSRLQRVAEALGAPCIDADGPDGPS